MDLVRADSITATDWQPKLGAPGAVVEGAADIDQCIQIILTTPKGSVPHRPDFGSDLWRYLGRPIDAARPNVIRETVEAIGRWERRVEVTRVTLRLADGAVGWVVLIERRIRAGGADGAVAVEVGL